MTIQDRIQNGEFLVKNHFDVEGNNGYAVGSTYIFNHIPFRVNEICTGDLEGMLWIGRAK